MFEPEVFRERMYCIKKVLGIFWRTLQSFGARGIVELFPPVRP